MINIEYEKLIKEFRETHLKEVGYNYKTVYDIISSMFKGIKNNIQSDTIPEIRIKYLGVFKPSEARIIFGLKNNIEKYENKSINKDNFLKRMVGLFHYIERTPEILKKTNCKERYLKAKDYVRDIQDRGE